MSIPVWPADAPSAEFSYKPEKPFVRTPMDSGIARHRRRFRVYPVVADVVFFMTQAQLTDYEEFAEKDLGGWASWFMLPIIDGRGSRFARVRFIDTPKPEFLGGGNWKVTGQVETLVGGGTT